MRVLLFFRRLADGELAGFQQLAQLLAHDHAIIRSFYPDANSAPDNTDDGDGNVVTDDEALADFACEY